MADAERLDSQYLGPGPLACAWPWQRQVDHGVYVFRAEIAVAAKASPSYVCQIAQLALLAPDIVERRGCPILNGRCNPASRL